MILAKCCRFTLQREGKFWKRKLQVSFGRNDDSKRKKIPSGWQESSVDTPALGRPSPHCCSDVDGRRIHPPASSPFLLRTLLPHREPSWVSATRAVDHQGKGNYAREGLSFPGILRNNATTHQETAPERCHPLSPHSTGPLRQTHLPGWSSGGG